MGCSAILKAGGAYLPLDPAYPRERLAFMLADAGAPVLVTHSALAGRLAAHHADTVRIDADAAAIAAQPASAPAVTLDPHHPAYVIYTSGSTGTPKGVVVAHRQLAQPDSGDADAVPIGPARRLLAVTTSALTSRPARFGCRFSPAPRWLSAPAMIVRDPPALHG